MKQFLAMLNAGLIVYALSMTGRSEPLLDL